MAEIKKYKVIQLIFNWLEIKDKVEKLEVEESLIIEETKTKQHYRITRLKKNE